MAKSKRQLKKEAWKARVAKRQWQPANKPRKAAKSKCLDCGATASIARYEYFKAARPRCLVCGGLMEYGGSMHGTR